MTKIYNEGKIAYNKGESIYSCLYWTSGFRVDNKKTKEWRLGFIEAWKEEHQSNEPERL